MSDKISVIIPVYNSSEYLRECVNSVLTQTYKNVEIVLVNDGSTDNSLEICNDFASKNKNVIVVDKENGGVCSARNAGLKVASGRYFTFLDADDLLHLSTLQILYSDLVENGANISSILLGQEFIMGEETPNVWRNEDALVNSLKDNPFTYSSCGKLYEKEFFEGVLFEEGRKIHEDSYFVFCCFLKKPTVVVRSSTLYYYRPNFNSASHAKFSEKYFDILYFANKKYEIICKDFPHLENYAKNLIVKANIAMLQTLLNVKGKYGCEIKNSIKTVKKNAKYFIPTYPGDKKRFLIIKLGLYRIFKAIYQIKYKNRVTKF